MLENTGTLIKIDSTHNNMRTNEFKGHFMNIPVVGNQFCIFGEPISENMSVRYIKTSPVKEVEQIYDKILEFKTQNSTYHLELE